jgi:hypothetical protein
MAIAGGPRGRLLVVPFLVLAAVVLASSPARAFYLPGVAPRDFQKVINPLALSSSDLAPGELPGRPCRWI